MGLLNKIKSRIPFDSPILAGWAPKTLEHLIRAVETNNLEEIRKCIAGGAPVNGKLPGGVTPLVLAASLGLGDIVRVLLECGADPNIATDEHLIPLDFAHNRGDLQIEELLTMTQNFEAGTLSRSYRCTCGTCRDLARFLDSADLLLPEAGYTWFKKRMRRDAGEEAASIAEKELKKTNYRALFEQLFGSEALACANFVGTNYYTARSPMALGAYDVSYAKRRGIDLVEQHKNKFEITDALLRKMLPDEIFVSPPRSVCEIGGAWGATIKHLMDRFDIEEYHNYEPDRHFAEWAVERFGVRKMPVDGETLRGTNTDSMDLVIANNTLIFVPPMKILSYFIEVRRVLRKNGLFVFNAIVSDQISENDVLNYLEGFFPRRTFQVVPRDFIDRIFQPRQFEVVEIFDREYFILRRIE